ncbi:hypothetical protein EVAR_14011_1 [Eumeta japonica]|uniref:Uncharacterized protein n=1 Tax=Eumeta variegata TaxID=151549 RepID=A0A4C1XD09_EUMVA|nr:hypothetical protein EVAR_14011_1 [Eumeta japonica]
MCGLSLKLDVAEEKVPEKNEQSRLTKQIDRVNVCDEWVGQAHRAGGAARVHVASYLLQSDLSLTPNMLE